MIAYSSCPPPPSPAETGHLGHLRPPEPVVGDRFPGEG
jgi:hypothetical protein